MKTLLLFEAAITEVVFCISGLTQDRFPRVKRHSGLTSGAVVQV